MEGFYYPPSSTPLHECDVPNVSYRLSLTGDPTKEIPVCQRTDVMCPHQQFLGGYIQCGVQAGIDFAEGRQKNRIIRNHQGEIKIITDHVVASLAERTCSAEEKREDSIENRLKEFLERMPFGKKQ